MSLKIDIIAIGRLRKGPYFTLLQDFSKRIKWSLTVFEPDSKITDARAAQIDETKKIMGHIADNAYVIALDERGKTMRSMAFADKLAGLRDTGHQHIQFVLGGADGLTDTVRTRANFCLSLGAATFPHMMARVMLIEQIYRAQQILTRHPYHRE